MNVQFVGTHSEERNPLINLFLYPKDHATNGGPCPKGFTQKSKLKRHKLGHAGHFHSCLLCGKSFLSKSSLKTHELTHTGEKAFTCMTCGKNFSQSSSLKFHENIHTGERAFKCVTCGKSFKQGSRVKAHELLRLVRRWVYTPPAEESTPVILWTCYSGKISEVFCFYEHLLFL